jgi:hypothetical protein
MNKWESKYQEEVNYLITKNFPILKNKVVVKEKSMPSKAKARYTLKGRTIFLNKDLRKYTIKALRGLFVHELSHLEINKKKGFGWFLSKIDIILAYSSAKYRQIIEKEADALTIKKGYKKELVITRRLLRPRNSRYYLSLEEIKVK